MSFPACPFFCKLYRFRIWRDGVLRSLDLLVPNGTLEARLTPTGLISIIDDDESVREALKSLMKSLGFTVEVFSSAIDFLASPRLLETSCLIADVQMPRMTGVELYSRLVETGHPIPTILITAHSDEGVRTRALKEGVICYLSKPFEEAVLLGCVRTALEHGTSPHRQ